MAELDAAKRYAQAAFDIALQANTIAAWRADLDDIAKVLAESGAAALLADQRVPLDRRLAMVDRTLDVQPLALNLAKLLVSKGRSLDARWVTESFNRMADSQEGIVHARVTTAVDLSAEELDGIRRQLSERLGKTVVAEAVVDPSIIGGLVVQVGDRLVDGSVTTRLKSLRRELEGAR
ncbi:MAG TPA: ATP synthase F1 subunit delta [Tepidiformaceae bacterium]|jgi:F-type H+-transporting ATPase subunit delta